jgi:hypothetical protein
MEAVDQDLNERLERARTWRLSLDLAAPLHVRLRGLVDTANERGTRATLQDIVSALILDSPLSSEQLRDLVMRYRTTQARDALAPFIEAPAEHQAIPISKPRPGRPRRAG